jgi:hypothetical protein
MGKLVQMETPEQVERVLGADIESATFEELSEKFDELQKELDEKTYSFSLSQDSIALLLQEILPNVEWIGQQAWDISEAQKLVTELKPDEVKESSKESIRALFQFVASNKYKGTDNVHTVKTLLTTLAEVIQQQIGKDEQILRDAGFELQAAEQGILPETAMQNVMKAKTESDEK